LAAYDKTSPLVIDPVLDYSTYLGGGSLDQGNSIAVDGSGNAYITGTTYSTNFPTTAGAYQTVFGGGLANVFITKMNVSGSALVYSTYLGGNGGFFGYGIAVDAGGNSYVTGQANSTNFPTTAGAIQPVYPGNICAFVAKLNATGNALLYSTYLGGGIQDIGYGIAVDGLGHAYVTGCTVGGFPTTAGAYQTVMGGGTNDAFVAKLNVSGTALVYSTYLGGRGLDQAYGIAVDAGGNAYVAGETSGNFPTTGGAYQTAYGGGSYDAFVSKLNASGSALMYSTYLGGSGSDQAYGIAVDAGGNAYVTGETNGNFPTTGGAYQTAYGGSSFGSEAFVAKLSASGSALVYSTYLGGSGGDIGKGIAVDSLGNAYVTGRTNSTNFPTTAGAYQTVFGGISNAFFTQLNPSGSALMYSTYLGGTGGDIGNGIAMDAGGNAYITGNTYSTNFPTTAGAYQTANGGGGDSFIAKFYFASPTPTPTVTAIPPCQSALFVSLNLFFSQNGQGPLTIGATLCNPGNCSVEIYNSAGEHIRTLANATNLPAGSFQVTWDGKNKYGAEVASGVYIIHMVEPLGLHQARVAVIR
jgi:hypothetical protein